MLLYLLAGPSLTRWAILAYYGGGLLVLVLLCSLHCSSSREPCRHYSHNRTLTGRLGSRVSESRRTSIRRASRTRCGWVSPPLQHRLGPGGAILAPRKR